MLGYNERKIKYGKELSEMSHVAKISISQDKNLVENHNLSSTKVKVEKIEKSFFFFFFL